MTKLSGGDSKSTLYCSFCGKSQHEVRKLIAGPTVFICDECVELCNDIIREETKSALVSKKDGGVPTPQEIQRIKNRMNSLYAQYTGKPIEEIEKAMDRDTFLESHEAKAFGLIDEVFDKRPAVADETGSPPVLPAS